MPILRSITSGLRSLLKKGQVERELDEELSGFLEAAAEEKMRQGLNRKDAVRAVRLERGAPEATKEVIRSARWESFVETCWQDLRFAARMLRKSPGFTAVAVLTLALGIGANTAIFSVIEAAFLKALPYPHSEQIVMVWEDVHLPHYQSDQNTPAPGNFADWKKRNSVFSSMAAIGYRSWNLTGSGEPERIEGEAFSSNIFSVLQIYPVLGRTFTTEEDHPGSSHVALIGYGLWNSRFGGDPRILGQKIFLDGEDYTVIGVMPPGFRFPDQDDQLYVPLALTEQQLANHGSHYLRVVARLKPGVTLAQAQSEMSLIASQITKQYPQSNTGVGVRLVPLRDQIAGSIRRPIFILFGVVGLLLLMVCANVANLLFARSSARGREFAVRATLGATPSRVARQLLVESLLLGILGGGLGLAFAVWGIYALRAFAALNEAFTRVQLDSTVCLFTLAVSLLSAVIFGLVPALQSLRQEPAHAMQEGARGSGPRTHLRVRGSLTVVEMALGVVVLIGTGLLLRSFVRLQSIPLGFQPENVLTLRVILRGPRYATLDQRSSFYQQALQRIGAIPGVRSAAGISFLPLTMQGRTTGIGIEGQAFLPPGQLPFADFRAVSPEYFSTMAIPILQGRDFSWNDTAATPLVVIVSQGMAHAFWPNANAIGKRIKLGPVDGTDPWITVVGIVANVRQLELTSEPRPAMYFPVTQDAGIGDTLRDWVIRSSGDPAAFAAAIRNTVWSLDAHLPVSRLQTMEHVRSSYLGPQRFELSLVGLFGFLCLILAAVGLYGVTAYSVSRRTNEIGIRMALGAERRNVLWLVVSNGAKLALLGVAAGSLAALALSRVMAGLLFEVAPTDPVAFVTASLVLILVALAACYIPARRATRVDPMIALRYE